MSLVSSLLLVDTRINTSAPNPPRQTTVRMLASNAYHAPACKKVRPLDPVSIMDSLILVTATQTG